MLQKMISLLVLMCWCQSTVIAQNTISNNSATVYSSLSARKYKIILNSKERVVAQSLDSLKANTLYTSGKNGPQKVSIDLIKTLKVAKKKRPRLRGFVTGAIGGTASGALLGFASYKESEGGVVDFGPDLNITIGSLVGFLVGSITGTLIGTSSNRYIHHDFSKVPPPNKYTVMNRILSGK